MPEVAHHLTNLPIADATPAVVVKSVLLTLRALRQGAPARPPGLIIVDYLACAGAYAEGLGPAVAFRQRRRGRSPALQPEAQNAQELLKRFRHWLRGEGDLDRVEFRDVEHFVLRGLEASGLVSGPRPKPRGRPAGTPYDEEAVRRKLSHRWRDYQRGTYSARQAIREVTEEIVLEQKQVISAWNGDNHLAAELGPEDEEAIAQTFHRIEVALYRLPKLTDQDVAAYRGEIARMLRCLKRVKNGFL